MGEDLKPAALRYATDDEPGTPAVETTPAGDIGPAALHYATDEEEPIVAEPAPEGSDPVVPEVGKETVTKKEGKKPTPYYRIPSKKSTKKGSDLMGGKRVTLKVEDLLRAGRSHFEIPKSQQEAGKKKPRRRRG